MTGYRSRMKDGEFVSFQWSDHMHELKDKVYRLGDASPRFGPSNGYGPLSVGNYDRTYDPDTREASYSRVVEATQSPFTKFNLAWHLGYFLPVVRYFLSLGKSVVPPSEITEGAKIKVISNFNSEIVNPLRKLLLSRMGYRGIQLWFYCCRELVTTTNPDTGELLFKYKEEEILSLIPCSLDTMLKEWTFGEKEVRMMALELSWLLFNRIPARNPRIIPTKERALKLLGDWRDALPGQKAIEYLEDNIWPKGLFTA
jgi:hypothetical protein